MPHPVSNSPMSRVIPLKLTREIQFERNGQSLTGLLRIDRLEAISDRKWACFWSCDYICDDGHVYGEDALHSLVNCTKLIRDLFAGGTKDGLKIWWQSPGDGCCM